MMSVPRMYMCAWPRFITLSMKCPPPPVMISFNTCAPVSSSSSVVPVAFGCDPSSSKPSRASKYDVYDTTGSEMSTGS